MRNVHATLLTLGRPENEILRNRSDTVQPLSDQAFTTAFLISASNPIYKYWSCSKNG